MGSCTCSVVAVAQWLSGCGGASNVVSMATAGPCGMAARGARAADAMAPHERKPPLGMLVTIATEHGATTITFGWWRTAGIHHNADTHTHTHRRACRAHNWPPTATQPPHSNQHGMVRHRKWTQKKIYHCVAHAYSIFLFNSLSHSGDPIPRAPCASVHVMCAPFHVE